MNSEEFIDVIKKVVREAAIKDIIENIEDPPGRRIKDEEKQRSDWFNELETNERAWVRTIVTDAVDEAVFGFLSVIDGCRAIEKGEKKGRLELIYKGQKNEILNDPEKIYLHDLYNVDD